MAHYAFLDDNDVVTDVIVGRDEWEVVDGISDWEAYYAAFRGQPCKRTSYNTVCGLRPDGTPGFRMNYAGIGFRYDKYRDAFVPPQPFLSWTLDEATCLWVAPQPMPDGGGPWAWDETTLAWVAA